MGKYKIQFKTFVKRGSKLSPSKTTFETKRTWNTKSSAEKILQKDIREQSRYRSASQMSKNAPVKGFTTSQRIVKSKKTRRL